MASRLGVLDAGYRGVQSDHGVSCPSPLVDG